MSSSSSEEDVSTIVKGKAFLKHLKEKEIEKEKVVVIEEKKKDESSATKTKKVKEKGKEKKAKDWTDEEITLLIEMLEERPCLWDVFDKEYSKRDVRDVAYTDIASALDVTIESLKAKVNGLRAQFGRELAKVNKTKSGQSTDELYVPSWIHYQNLLFLAPVVKSSKSRDTLKHKITEVENDAEEEIKFQTPAQKKKSIADRGGSRILAE